MARRKRLKAKPAAPTQRDPTAVSPDVFVRDSTACLSPPNHLVPAAQTGRNPYPVLDLRREYPEYNSATMPVFRDPRYGEPFMDYVEPQNTPPTWMDPVVLLSLARQDPAIQKLLDECITSRNKTKALAKLPALLLDVLTSQYIDYLVTQFEQAAPVLSEWMILNHAARHLEAEQQPAINLELAEARRRRGLTFAADQLEIAQKVS